MSLCFEISLNGAPPVVAGGDSLAVVTAMAVMRWERGVPEVELQVGGLATAPARQRWSWVERTLGVGDRITITVVESGSRTAPDRVEGEDPQWRERQERNYYEHLRRKFGDTP
jgi:hypothetical protein